MQWVYGNEGHDTFWIGNNYRGNHAIYNTSGVDSLVINDFTSGEDHIRLALSPTAANPTTVNQVFTRLLGAPLQTTADWDALLSLASASGSAAARGAQHPAAGAGSALGAAAAQRAGAAVSGAVDAVLQNTGNQSAPQRKRPHDPLPQTVLGRYGGDER